MSSTTPARELLNRATKQMRKLPSFFTEDEMKEFYPTDGDMEHLWRTWCEARENDLHAMNKELEDGATTTYTIYEECAGVDEKNYEYIDHGVLSAKYHEHLLPYIVGVYRVLGFYGTHHVLTREENYIVETICHRVSEYIMDYLTKKVKETGDE